MVKGTVHEPFLEYGAWQEIDLSLLCCAGAVAIHTDAPDIPRHSYHAVLINDGFAAKRPEQPRTKCNHQPPGTILYLDAHEPHHLVRTRQTMLVDYGGWVSLVFNTDEPIDITEVMSRFDRIRQINPPSLNL